MSKPKHVQKMPTDFSNEAIFRAQAVEKERIARLPLATKLRMLKELVDWAQPLEKALKDGH